MPISVVTCKCGSTEQLARRFLNRAGYIHWADIPIVKGKEESLRLIGGLPHYPELDMLTNYIKSASKWVVIIGWNENGCRWADLVHSPTKSDVEGQVIVDTFAF